MPKVRYETWRPQTDSLVAVRHAIAICDDYQSQGYDLTLRQMYYRFVAQDLFPDDRKWSWTGARWVRDPDGTKNAEPNYKWLGDIVNKARLAGYMDWNHIVDRTRNLESVTHWSNPADIIRGAARGYAIDKWANQPTRVEVWVEKEALAGVVDRVATRNDVDWFACRGYVSQSEQWVAAQRIGAYIDGGQNVVILHLGDHDPSGIDMTRDIRQRITDFTTQDYLNAHGDEFEGDSVRVSDIGAAMRGWCHGNMPFEVRRIALNMDQIEQYDPPPNPAKTTDSRFRAYRDIHGDESWELDALDPATLDELIEGEIVAERDDDLWEDDVDHEETDRAQLTAVSRRWPDVARFVAPDTEDED